MDGSNAASLPTCILEEIGFEGLEGITVEGLWKRIGVRLKLMPLPLNKRLRNDIWKFVQNAKCLQYYELPEEREPLKLFDRSEVMDPFFGVPEPETCPYNLYKYNPISNQDVRGSCEHFETRIEIPREDVAKYTADKIEQKYGLRFVIVASQSLRNSLLISPCISKDLELTITAYCILERVGRARFNGEFAHGKWSLADVSDSVGLHHKKKKLVRYELIKTQSFTQTIDGQNTTVQLIHLPRFFARFKQRHMILIEKVIDILRPKPNCMAEYQDVKSQFEEGLQKSLSRLFKSPLFHRFVLTDRRVPYRAMYPDASEKEWRIPKNKHERSLNVVQLRDPNIEPEKFWFTLDVDNEGDDEEGENGGFLDDSNSIKDVPLLYQLYRLIESTKENGISESEASAYLGQSKLNGRAMIRSLLREKQIEYYNTSKQRQTVRQYVLPKYNKRGHQSVDELITEPSEFSTEPSEEYADISEIVHVPSNQRGIVPIDKNQEQTSVDTVKMEGNGNNGVTVFEVIHMETEEEPETITFDEPFRKDRDDHRSRIEDETTVRITEVKGPSQGFPQKRLLRDDHLTDKMKERIIFIQREVQSKILFDDPSKLHNAMKHDEAMRGLTDIMCRKTFFRLLEYLSQKEKIRLWRIDFQYQSKHRSLTYISNRSVDSNYSLMQSCIEQHKSKFQLNIYEEECRKENRKAKANTTAAPNEEVVKEPLQKLTVSTNPTFNYGITPKFIRMRSLHEFMFYLARDHTSVELTNQDEIVAQLKASSPTLFDDIDELPMIWNNEISWKMFIPPLIKHTGYDQGWCLLSDCIFRMPLSIFVKIVNITFEIKGLQEFIDHPIKKHFLVKDIPINLKKMLYTGRKYVASLHDLLRRLTCIGLVQCGPNNTVQNKEQAFYYMNILASLLDTSPSAPGAYYISEQEYTELVYQFDSLEDVIQYWDDMHRICMSTKLNRKPIGVNTPHEKALPSKFQQYLNVIQPNHAKSRDQGELPGDHRGAAGLDSCFFAHLERNWSANPMKYKSKVPKVKSDTKPTRFNRLHRVVRDIRKKHESRITAVALHKLKSSAIRRRTKPVLRKRTALVKKKRIRNKYDDIDRIALKHMNKLRVDWNPQEDDFLLLCKVASLYLNPRNRLLIPGQILRDLIHWHCKSLNKTSFACRRRINYILKKLPNSSQINNSIMMCINEIKSNKSLEKRFGSNFIDRLKRVYEDEFEFNRAFQIHFIDLVHTLSCQYYNLTNSFESNVAILPRTLQEFNARFKEREDSVYDSNTMRYDEPDSVDDIKIAQIVTLIHSTVCCSYDKTSWSIQLYEIYKDFPETLLSLAMQKVRSDQMISQHKLNSSQNKVQNRCLPLSSSGFHLSMTYQQQMTTKIAYDTFDDAYENIKSIFEDVNNRKQMHVLNLSNSAVCFFISELSKKINYDISIEIPKRILLLDPTKRLPEDSFDGVYARFHEIFNYIPKVDFTGTDDSLDDFINDLPNSEDKSQSINETKNIVKKLEELPAEILHFFCIVDNFEMTKPRNQLELTEDGKCPYNCLKQLEKPFETIMDKIVAKREIWYRLNIEQFEMEPLPAVVKIDETNIVAIYNYLVLKGANATDQQRNANLELFRQTSEIVDELLLENDREFDEDFGAEYDLRSDVKKKMYDGAQINDKIHKFHDFLCVNTCKLSLVPTDVDTNSDDMIDLNDLSKKRDAILAKIVQNSNWSAELRSDKDFVELLKEKGFDMQEIHIAVDVFNYLDSQGEIGATAATLYKRYEDKDFLQKLLDFFNEEKLVMKTGVCQVTYVHWKHITPWTVNTYHLKRLDREATTPSPKALLQLSDASSSTTATKRKTSENDPNETKRTKVDETRKNDETEKDGTTNDVDLTASAQDEQLEVINAECDKQSQVIQPKTSARLSKRFSESIIEHGGEMKAETIPQTKKTFPLKMAPWIRVNGSINRRVLDKYAGTILLHCIEHVGLTLFTLCTRFHYLLPIHVHEIVQHLEEFGCITKTAITKRKKVTLFSKYESVSTGPATDLDDFKDIVIEPTIDAVVKMSIFIGNKKYKEDFI